MSDTITLACPHCSALNRINQTRLKDNPVCGKCRQPLFAGKPVAITESNFNNLAVRSQLPVVVDFWAGWCGPCQAMAPIFNQVCAKLEPRLRFAKLDTEAEAGLAGRFGIRSIPTLVVFQQGRELSRQAGLMQAGQMQQWLEPYLV